VRDVLGNQKENASQSPVDEKYRKPSPLKNGNPVRRANDIFE
jgi:hypothetical protein